MGFCIIITLDRKKFPPMKKTAKIALFALFAMMFLTRSSGLAMNSKDKVRTIRSMLPRDIMNNGGL